MKELYGIIYLTTCLVNNKVYVGQTINWQDKSYLGSGTRDFETLLFSGSIRCLGNGYG